ncbi:MAG: 3-phosphoshikimate 1-carboxyvinyltransferase [Anaerolineae bacterium]|nr:3-phosphoshikimate 1-carboxyvinyltransferase [Anaerolineae bacterium]MDQ7035729.1 3-phosphoshikimate 1-carboxyvinyltransferase [Anaerolineae bacterium]
MDTLTVKPGSPLRGRTKVPGDKSISHRSLLLGMLANGKTEIRGWLAAGDTEATLGAVRALGVQVDRHDTHTLTVHGGMLKPPDAPLGFINAGTGIRLAAGIMAGQSFPSTLDGSYQLRRRPMKRITNPLQEMGAKITSTNGKCPLNIEPTQLKGFRYEMPMASAQVKSAVLLAGLFADGETTVIQPGSARDHTEIMLKAMGADIQVDGKEITVKSGSELQAMDLTVPGDFSSAAFLIVAGLIIPNSDLTIEGVNLNPTRTGLLDVLLEMGAKIEVTETATEAGERVGDIRVQYSELSGIEIGGDTVVRMIDEFPVLMVAALYSDGETVVRDAKELRVKETDRIAVMAQELRKLGATIEEREDGFRIVGRQNLTGFTVDGHDDHRVAMSLTIAGLLADEMTVITDAQCASDSFPGFADTLQNLGGRMLEQPIN